MISSEGGSGSTMKHRRAELLRGKVSWMTPSDRWNTHFPQRRPRFLQDLEELSFQLLPPSYLFCVSGLLLSTSFSLDVGSLPLTEGRGRLWGRNGGRERQPRCGLPLTSCLHMSQRAFLARFQSSPPRLRATGVATVWGRRMSAAAGAAVRPVRETGQH